MKVHSAASLLAFLVAAPAASAQLSYNVSYATYLGGQHWEHARDVITDSSGFTYVVGGTGSPNFTGYNTFPEANVYNAGLTQTYVNGVNGTMSYNPADGAFGPCDVFITKLNQSGQVVWTKYMGGQNYDRAYAVELDTSGNVFVSGRAGIGFPTTAGLQTTFSGTTGGSSNYGKQNAFVSKLNSSGQVQWSTYLGTGELARDMAIDANGDVYVPLTLAANSSRNFTTTALNSYFAGKFTNSPPTTNTTDVGVAKIDGDTGQLLWARWIGGTGSETTNPSIRVNNAGEAYLLFHTNSTNTSLAAVGTGVQTNNGGGEDEYLAKFKADGSGLVFGTYLGGAGDEVHETHSLALDQNGNAVVAISTTSTDFATAGKLNITSGTASSVGIARFDANGVKTMAAVVGGSGGENPDGVYVDQNGRVFIVGETSSTNFPVTGTALQSANAGSNDAFILVLSADLTTIEYATYYGGTLYDNGRTMFLGTDGAIYMAGGTLSTNLPTLNAADSTFNGGAHQFAPGSGDAWAAKLTVAPEPASLAWLLSAGLLLRRRPRVTGSPGSSSR